MSDQVWWYATRAAGLMTWSTAVASVVVGLLLSTRVVKSRTGPWMLDLHRFLGGISVLFLVVHMGTLYMDSFVDFGPRELFIPGESSWNTEAAAWGIIAAYALILVELTSLLRKWISNQVWRTFHMLSVVTAVAGSYHAWMGGTDVDNPLTWLIAGVGSALVIALVAIRLGKSEKPSSPRLAKANDREAILQEMRDRLESLPIPENTAQPELTPDGGTLPRRAPVTALGSSEPEALNEAPFDPFNLHGAAPEAAAPAADPFTAAPVADPFTVAPAEEPANPFTVPTANDTSAPAAPVSEVAEFHVRPDPFGGGHAPQPAPDPFTVAPDPFGAPAAPDPFAVPADPFPAQPDPAPAMETPIAPAPAPFYEAAEAPPVMPGDTPFPAPAAPPEPEPYGFDPASPFGSETPPATVPVTPTEPPLDPLSAPPVDAGLFAPASPAEEAAEVRAAQPFPEFNEPETNPFQPVDPAPAPAQVHATPPPAPAPPQPAPAHAAPAPSPAPMQAAPAPMAAPAPPPLPNLAVDPTTGEPDEAAYTAWLVEWLAFAEKYGEEAPEDPSRVF